ncbi:hypothetical protein TELCIR_09624, partial [Teladorsagia circumcincta]
MLHYYRTRLLKPYYHMEYADLLDRIELDCDGLLRNNYNVVQEAKLLQYNTYAVEKLLLDADDRTRLLKPYYHMEYADLLDRIELDCDGLLRNNYNVVQEAKLLQYNTYAVEKLLLDADDRCFAIRSLFGFDRKPVSQEERDYPLAYGLIVYKNLVQMLFMLSSFYRPQNEYCIAVSGGADTMFKLIIDEVDACFDNIQVL